MINTVVLAMKVTNPIEKNFSFFFILRNENRRFFQYNKQPENYSKALDYLNIVFTAIFALEFVLKMAAFHLRVNRIDSTRNSIGFVSLFFRIISAIRRIVVILSLLSEV